MTNAPSTPTPSIALENLKARFDGLAAEHQRCEERLSELEEQNIQLVHLNVASQRLHETMTRRDVLAAIEEIIINLVGSEQVAIFEVADESLVLLRASGVAPAHLDPVRFGRGTIGAVAVSGAAWIAERAGEQRPDKSTPGLTAVIPLKVRDIVIGVVAIFDLLAQKNALEPIDHQLFNLLSRQGAVALYCTSFDTTRPTARPPRFESRTEEP